MRLLPIILLAVTAIYWPGLAGGFVFDDYANIVNNPSLKLFDGSLASLWAASGDGSASPLGRQLSLASFAVNLHFGGDSPFYFKLTNLLIHLANGLLVYLLIEKLWPLLVGGARTTYAALWITAVWLLHPINLTPVLFVVQRMTSLATFFTLASLCLYVHGRRQFGGKRWVALILALLVSWPAGILSKESALLLPLFILLIEWLAFSGLRAIPKKYRLLSLVLLPLLAYGALSASWGLVESTYRIRNFTVVERLLTEARVLWLYCGQLFFPWPDFFSLHHDDIAISRSLLEPPTTALAILMWLAAAGFAISVRKNRPWLTFALLWFLFGHALESTILGLEIAYEHRNYLPSVGIFFGIAACLFPSPTAKGQASRIALALAFVALCGLVTGLRAAQWGDEYIRTQIEANSHPASARTHYEAALAILGKTLPTGSMNSAAYHMARIHFQRAADYDPSSKAAPAGILYLDCSIGMPKDLEAQQMLLKRLANERFTLGDQSFIQGLSDMLDHKLMCLSNREVEDLLSAALSNPQATGKIRGMLHAVAMDYAAASLGSLPRAKTHAMAAVESDPGNPVFRLNLIRVLLQLHETSNAKQQYAELKKLRIPVAIRKEVDNLALGLEN